MIVCFVLIFKIGMAQIPPSSPEEASLDLYLDQHLGSNEFYDRYDQPNAKVWDEYVSWEKKRAGINEITKTFRKNGAAFKDNYGAELSKTVEHGKVWPLAIELKSVDEGYTGFQEKASEAYEEDATLEKFINELQTSFGEVEEIGDETCAPFDESASDSYGVGCFCEVPVLLKGQKMTENPDLTPLEERWENFKEFHDYLKIDDIEDKGNDLEKLMIMNEQEKMSILGGRGEREDAMLERAYQNQEDVIRMLAKLMVIKEQLKNLDKKMPKIKKGTVQEMLTQKLRGDDYLDGLWALRRQLESLSIQFDVARRGRNTNIKEPVVYRYDRDNSTPDEKVIKSKEKP